MQLTSRSVPRILLLVVLALVVASMVVPRSALDFLRLEYAWAHEVAEFLDTIVPGMDFDHVTAFAALGLMARFGWPRGRAAHVILGIMLVAAITEAAQIWIPGRSAEATHAMLDVCGGLIGYGFASLVAYAWGPQSLGSLAQRQ
jgi:hypothetical protein